MRPMRNAARTLPLDPRGPQGIPEYVEAIKARQTENAMENYESLRSDRRVLLAALRDTEAKSLALGWRGGP